MKNVGFKVIDAGIGPYFGVETDGDHLYLLQDFTVTHNSHTALHVAKQLETNALIVVPTNEILDQFKATAELFGVEAGVIKGKKEEVEGLVTLTTYQTLSRRIDPKHNKGKVPGYLNKFGLLVVDEAALAGAPSLQTVINAINSRYRLSVSADFFRADGLVAVYELCLGEVIVRGKKSEGIEKVLYTPELPKIVAMNRACDWSGEFSVAKYKTLLGESEVYNDWLVDLCKQLIKKGDRRVLLKVERITQSEILHKKLGELSGLFTGKVKEDVLRAAATKPVILYTKSNLGLDMSKFIGEEEEKKIAPLNTVIVASPSANTLQIAGRICRNEPTKGCPKGIIIIPKIDDYFSKSQLKKDIKKNWTELRQVKDLKEVL